MIAMLDYSLIWNLLHYPLGIIPITKVNEKDDSNYNDGFND